MTTEYTGAGDPTRSMQLLWSTAAPPRRGPRPRFTVAEIVRAAIDLADAAGLETLSMRGVADALGVPVMTLYTYVPGKAELLDVMLDTVAGETARPPITSWRPALETVARENWALCHRHPWMLHVAAYRPPLGPNIIAKYDYELSTMDGSGLSDVEIDSVLTLVLGYVQGAARASVEAQLAEARTGISDADWWAANAPLLEQAMDPARYPTATRIGAAAGEEYGAAYAPDHGFEFGLARILDGIEALIQRPR
jgi:AcrR family transcriptional regulator